MMKRKSFRFTIVFLVFLFSTESYPQAAAPKAALSGSSIDFGTIRKGQKIEKTLAITNNGNADLVISGMKMSMSGLIVKAKQIISPAEQTTIYVELNTASLNGEVQGDVLLITNDPLSPQLRIDIKVKVESTVKILPEPAIFLSAFRWEIPTKESNITIVNEGKDPLAVLDVQTEGEGFTPEVKTIEEGKRYKLSVKLNPDVVPGKAAGRITVDTGQEKIQIAVYTFLKEKVYANPTYLDFGRIDLEDIEKEPELLNHRKISVFIYQYQGQDFQIQIQSSPSFLSIEKEPSEARGSVINIPGQGKTAIFELIVSPVKEQLRPGKFQDVIKISTNDKDFPLLEIAVSVEVV